MKTSASLSFKSGGLQVLLMYLSIWTLIFNYVLGTSTDLTDAIYGLKTNASLSFNIRWLSDTICVCAHIVRNCSQCLKLISVLPISDVIQKGCFQDVLSSYHFIMFDIYLSEMIPVHTLSTLINPFSRLSITQLSSAKFENPTTSSAVLFSCAMYIKLTISYRHSQLAAISPWLLQM